MFDIRNVRIRQCCAFLGLGTLLFTAQMSAQTITYYQTGEEFVGPLGGWKNVKTDYGAKGDGVTDDAAAINVGLDALKATSTNTYCVLYFPAGTYRINSSLVNSGRAVGDEYSGIGIIGEDPATTVLSWNGTTDSVMFYLDGWNLKISRLTFDGKSTAKYGLARIGRFGTGCEVSDVFFKDISFGALQFAGMLNSQGQAEHLVKRCRFSRCGTGLNIQSMNSLDIWVWYCLFEDCTYGMNGCGYQSYENVFLRSKKADHANGIQPISIVNNTSINSNYFIIPGGEPTFIYGNKIFNPDTLKYTGSQLVFLDNTVLSRPGRVSAFHSNFSPQGAIIVGNTFTVATPIINPSRYHYYSYSQKIVESSTLPVPATVELPGTPPKMGRKIFEVTRNNADDIQVKIVAACAEPNGTKPVVHIPKGNYSVRSTIVIPANKEISIIGDGSGGFGTSVTGGAPTIKLLAPNRALIQDIDFSGNEAIYVEVSDQAGSRVLGNLFNAQGVDASRLCNQALIVDGVEQSELTFAGTGIQRCASGVLVKGGTILSSGGTTQGQVAFLSGASSAGRDLWNVQNKGKLIGQGFWYEADISSSKPLFALPSTSSGTVALATMFWCHDPSPVLPIGSIDNFNGSVTMVASTLLKYQTTLHYWSLTGSGSNTRVLVGGVKFTSGTGTVQDVWKDQTTPAAAAAIINANAFGTLTNKTIGLEPDLQFILKSLELIRSLKISKPIAKQTGLTDIRFNRVVGISNGGTAVRFVAKPGDPNVGVLNNAVTTRPSCRQKVERTVMMGGSHARIPEMAKSVKVYTVLGRLVYQATIDNVRDVRPVEKAIAQYGRHEMVIIRVFQ